MFVTKENHKLYDISLEVFAIVLCIVVWSDFLKFSNPQFLIVLLNSNLLLEVELS